MHATYTPSFTIDYDEDHHLVTVEVEGLITQKDNLALLEKLSNQVLATDADRLLINAQRSKTTPSETIKWVSEDYLNVLGQWLPSYHHKIKIARIESHEICKQLQNTIIDKVRQAFATSIEISFFRDPNSARQWLMN